MARPAKSVRTKTGVITKEEQNIRLAVEDKLRGNADRLCAPDYLTDEQKAVFEFVVAELTEKDILSNLDVYVLVSLSVAVARLQQIEAMINAEPEYLFDSALMGARSKYQSDMWRGCSELCLSPQARAKLGGLATQSAKAESNPLLDALRSD